MDHLFSPWRYRYLTDPRLTSGACVLCAKIAAGDEARDADNYVVLRGVFNAVILNLYPYTTGHLMILPYAHIGTLGEAGQEGRAEMVELAARAEAALTAEYKPQGLNVGLNLGEAAGAGIAGHLHLHVVPRWNGDSNFMSVVGETRVLPELLSDTYDRMRARFSALRSGPRP